MYWWAIYPRGGDYEVVGPYNDEVEATEAGMLRTRILGLRTEPIIYPSSYPTEDQALEEYIREGMGGTSGPSDFIGGS